MKEKETDKRKKKYNGHLGWKVLHFRYKIHCYRVLLNCIKI